jgi:hypothetical protein
MLIVRWKEDVGRMLMKFGTQRSHTAAIDFWWARKGIQETRPVSRVVPHYILYFVVEFTSGVIKNRSF